MSEVGRVKKLFRRFERHLSQAGLMGHEGKIIDASFVDVPRQRNTREENEEIKAGKVPACLCSGRQACLCSGRQVGLLNLVYNVARYEQIMRLKLE